MNFQVLWTAVQPFLTQLLASPQFQAVLQKILSDVLARINAGVHPTVATNQAAGQIAAAAVLHLTGNPIADVQAWLANFKTPTGGPTPPPVTGSFTS